MGTQNIFFSLNNPIIFSVLLTLALLGVIYIFYVHIIIPLQRKYLRERESLELKNARMMALFAELDPNPILRFDPEGNILLVNRAGQHLFKKWADNKLSVTELFHALKEINLKECIEQGDSHQFSTMIKHDYYDVMVKGVPEMQFGQIYCNNITQRKQIEEELTSSRKKLRELSNHMQNVQEEEKQKISRELHDGLGQVLTSIRINMEILKEHGHNGRAKMDDISSLIDTAMTEIKEISYRLKPRILDDFGLVPSLKQLCAEVSARSGIKGMFQAVKFSGRLDSNLETGLYRIAQEALNNIVKHSQATEFSLQLVKHPSILRMMVEDDGIGFDSNNIREDVSKQNSMGLVNMSERVLSFNGRLIVDSQKGRGTEIIVEIPLPENNNE